MNWSRTCAAFCVMTTVAWGAGRMRAGDEHMRVEATKIRVLIEEDLATTEVEQVFANDSDLPAEAAYEFPLPAGGTFSGLSIWVNGEEIQGEVVARARAEEVYTDVTGIDVRPQELRPEQREPVVIRTRDPGLLQIDGRRLRLRVAPVPARGSQRVRIRYVQAVDVEGGRGRYVFPLALDGVASVRTGELDCEVLLRSGEGLLGVKSPSHPQGRLETLVPGAVYRFTAAARDVLLDRDLEVQFRHPARTYPRLTVAASRTGEGPGAVQLSLTPWLPKGAISRGRDVVVVVDCSASMAARRNSSYHAARGILGALTPADRFELVTFNLSAQAVTGELGAATPARIRAALKRLHIAERAGEADPRSLLRQIGRLERSGRPLDVALVTDPQLSDNEGLLRSLAVRARKAGVRVFPIELGDSRNPQAPLQALARRTGASAVAAIPIQAFKGGAALGVEIARPVLRWPSLRFEGVELSEVVPTQTPPVLSVGRPVRLYARYANPGSGRAILEATAPDGRRLRWTLNLTLPEHGEHLEVSRMWARASADDLLEALAANGLELERRSALEADLLRVSLAGPVLTQATSLIVLESEALFAQYGIERTNRDLITRERTAQEVREARLEDDVQAYRQGGSASESYASRDSGRVWSGGGGSGGGAGGPLFFLLGLAALGVRRR